MVFNKKIFSYLHPEEMDMSIKKIDSKKDYNL